MAGSVVRTTGFRELDAALGELPKATAVNVLKRTATKALGPMADDAQAGAPRLSGELAISVTVGTKLSRAQRAQHRKQSKVEVFMGPGPQPQGVQQEFGNERHPAQPFMRPAWQNGKDKLLEDVGHDLWDEIKKAAERKARKQAR